MINGTQDINRDILIQVANGSEAAFTILFHRFRNRIFTVAYKLTNSDLLAEEVVQDVFLKVWLKREKLLEVEDFASFLFIVARNEAYSCMRAVVREELKGKKLESWMPRNIEQADDRLLEKEFSAILQEAIERLPERQREIYRLSKDQGLKREEIARRLNISPETVKAHLAQAVKSVRAYCISRLPIGLIALFLHKL